MEGDMVSSMDEWTATGVNEASVLWVLEIEVPFRSDFTFSSASSSNFRISKSL